MFFHYVSSALHKLVKLPKNNLDVKILLYWSVSMPNGTQRHIGFHSSSSYQININIRIACRVEYFSYVKQQSYSDVRVASRDFFSLFNCDNSLYMLFVSNLIAPLTSHLWICVTNCFDNMVILIYIWPLNHFAVSEIC